MSGGEIVSAKVTSLQPTRTGGEYAGFRTDDGRSGVVETPHRLRVDQPIYVRRLASGWAFIPASQVLG